MKINNFRGDPTDISTKKEHLNVSLSTTLSMLYTVIARMFNDTYLRLCSRSAFSTACLNAAYVVSLKYPPSLASIKLCSNFACDNLSSIQAREFAPFGARKHGVNILHALIWEPGRRNLMLTMIIHNSSEQNNISFSEVT